MAYQIFDPLTGKLKTVSGTAPSPVQNDPLYKAVTQTQQSMSPTPFYPTPTGTAPRLDGSYSPTGQLITNKTTAVTSAPKPSTAPTTSLPLRSATTMDGTSKTQPLAPAPTPVDDFSALYERMSGVQAVTDAEKQLTDARAAETKAYETSQAQKTALIESSNKLFNDLFNSPDIVSSKADRDKAFAELQKIDADETVATSSLRESIRNKGTPSWAGAGQLRILSEGFAAQRANYAAQYNIAAGRLADAKEYAAQAYNHGISVLEAKIGLVEDALKRAQTLTEQEKADYEGVLERAKELYESKKTDQDNAIDLYLKLVQAGVSGISPTMSIQEMTAKAGPVLAKMAQDSLALERSTKQAALNKSVNENKLLTIAEAEKLGVPYGTTVGQAILMGKTPGATGSDSADISNIGLVNEILGGNTDAIFGVSRFLTAPSITAPETYNKYKQLEGILALGARQLIKGSGSVSDYEARILSQASSSLGQNLGNEAGVRELKKIRGVLTTNAGLTTPVKITTPDGKVDEGDLSGEQIYSAILQGYKVEYL